jgi:hypothetical protein
MQDTKQLAHGVFRLFKSLKCPLLFARLLPAAPAYKVSQSLFIKVQGVSIVHKTAWHRENVHRKQGKSLGNFQNANDFADLSAKIALNGVLMSLKRRAHDEPHNDCSVTLINFIVCAKKKELFIDVTS